MVENVWEMCSNMCEMGKSEWGMVEIVVRNVWKCVRNGWK